jgi:hypothetical protein
LTANHSRRRCAGLEYISKLTDHEQLSLDMDEISDAGLDRLVEFGGIHDLQLGMNQVTDAGVTKFEEALAKCQIIFV